MKTFCVDAGHGGMHEGKYMTDPKWGKFYKHSDTFTAYEGVTNRAIAAKLIAKFKAAGFVYHTVYHEYLDTPLSGLVVNANGVNAPNRFFLSIHSNAGKGKGFEVFTSKGETESDKYAEVICNQLIHDFPEYPLRQDTRDGDKDKEEDFYVLKHTAMPAVLCELLFFDELEQALYLNSEHGQERIAESLFKACKIINDMK